MKRLRGQLYWAYRTTHREWAENLMMWIAWRLPRDLVFWCAIRLITAAYCGRHSDAVMGTLTTDQVVAAWRDGE